MFFDHRHDFGPELTIASGDLEDVLMFS